MCFSSNFHKFWSKKGQYNIKSYHLKIEKLYNLRSFGFWAWPVTHMVNPLSLERILALFHSWNIVHVCILVVFVRCSCWYFCVVFGGSLSVSVGFMVFLFCTFFFFLSAHQLLCQGRNAIFSPAPLRGRQKYLQFGSVPSTHPECHNHIGTTAAAAIETEAIKGSALHKKGGHTPFG